MSVDIPDTVAVEAARQHDDHLLGYVRNGTKVVVDADTADTDDTPTFRFHSGGEWIAAADEVVPAVWGRGGEVLWASGEPLYVVGPPGVGKTTLTGQLVRARLVDDPLGVVAWPVVPGEHRTLYLACDRPRQIQRSMARHLSDIDPAVLDDRLRIQHGPPPGDLAKDPTLLLRMAQAAGADTVVVDSLKDVAVGLSDDDVGAGWNQATQHVVANGIELLVLHHQRKGQNGTKPKTLEDVYGSTWLTAGAGSVLLLWGKAGDLLVDMLHLKQPSEVVGPHKLEHDHAKGITRLADSDFDPVDYLRKRGGWVTARDIAGARHGTTTPSETQVGSERRKLNGLVDRGVLEVTGGPVDGAPGASANRYRVPTGQLPDPAP